MSDERSRGPMTYRLYVIGPTVAEVVAHSAGLIVDRVMSGWRVSVAVEDVADAGPVRILGADVVDLGVVAQPGDECCAVAIASELYADGRVRRILTRSAEVLVWGAASGPEPDVQHRVSAAGRAFKAQALAALGVPVSSVDGSEEFCAQLRYRVRVAR